MKKVKIGKITVGKSGSLVFIMGPCVIESESSAMKIAETLKKISADIKAPLVFKASYDKANRTSADSFRGPGLKKGLKILAKIKERFSLPVLTDVHCSHEVEEVAAVADCLQIPAYLCRQTDLIIAAAKTGKAVNIKKGQFMSPHGMAHALKKAHSAGNENLLLTERGATFGYGDLVVDFRSIPVMRSFGWPVVFDATHSVQKPGGLGSASGGDRSMVVYLAKASVAVGADAVFMEVHPNPDKAMSDGPNSLAVKDVKSVMEELGALKYYASKG